MCRDAGVPSSLMWVTDRSNTLFNAMYLSTNQLDDEIAFVTIDGKEVALDPGTKFAPYSVINWRYTGSRGLKQNSAGKVELAESPAPTRGGDAIQRAGTFKLSDEGEAQGTLIVRFYGQKRFRAESRVRVRTMRAVRRILEDEVKEWLPLIQKSPL